MESGIIIYLIVKFPDPAICLGARNFLIMSTIRMRKISSPVKTKQLIT